MTRRTTEQHRSATALAITQGASAHSTIDSLRPLPMRANTKQETVITKPDAHAAALVAKHEHDYALVSAVKPSDIADEIGQGEFLKKADLATMGQFNLVGVSLRTNLKYNGRPSADQYTFEVQLLEGEHRGARALCSFDVNIVRAKYAQAVQRHGAVGPLTLEKRKNAFVFVAEGVTSATADVEETGLPFDAE